MHDMAADDQGYKQRFSLPVHLMHSYIITLAHLLILWFTLLCMEITLIYTRLEILNIYIGRQVRLSVTSSASLILFYV